jgi:hypothetical protein
MRLTSIGNSADMVLLECGGLRVLEGIRQIQGEGLTVIRDP